MFFLLMKIMYGHFPIKVKVYSVKFRQTFFKVHFLNFPHLFLAKPFNIKHLKRSWSGHNLGFNGKV